MPLSPLLTSDLHDRLIRARRAGTEQLECSLDLNRTMTTVRIDEASWSHAGQSFPYLAQCRERTIYHWDGHAFSPVSRFSGSLIKLVPTEWGPPTFEIDGIKMLPTARVSPYEDAAWKVSLVQPRGRIVLDTCGGLGYFAAHCLEQQARQIVSFEKNPDVIWLRTLNPWSPEGSGVDRTALTLSAGDVSQAIGSLASASMDAALHDPPRFGIAGELYSQAFYNELARVLRRGARLFHYTGTPNKLTSGRDVPNEVSKRLRQAGFRTELKGDGVLAMRVR